MTLILTELSDQGIVMVADSAISKINPYTNQISSVDTVGWSKIVRVPKIQAAVSYWGAIGAVTRQQFDLWLKTVIAKSDNYNNIHSFAAYLATKLNDACGNKPLDKGLNTGVHVAGYSEWPDGQKRPVFIHIHNGHLYMEIIPQKDGSGMLVGIEPKLHSDNIKLFEVHNDFPDISKSLEDNLRTLDQSLLTHNGEYLPFLFIWNALQQAFALLNLTKEFSIPANPTNLGSRKDYLHMAMETVIRIYLCSNKKQKPVIGGKAISLGITANNYLLPIDEGVG